MYSPYRQQPAVPVTAHWAPTPVAPVVSPITLITFSRGDAFKIGFFGFFGMVAAYITVAAIVSVFAGIILIAFASQFHHA